MMKDSQGFKLDGSTVIAALEEGTCCKYMSVLKNVHRDGKLVLESAIVYLQFLSVIWSSPLSD